MPNLSGMVENLCTHYGEQISSINGKTYYNFPTIENLSHKGVETKLRELGTNSNKMPLITIFVHKPFKQKFENFYEKISTSL